MLDAGAKLGNNQDRKNFLLMRMVAHFWVSWIWLLLNLWLRRTNWLSNPNCGLENDFRDQGGFKLIKKPVKCNIAGQKTPSVKSKFLPLTRFIKVSGSFTRVSPAGHWRLFVRASSPGPKKLHHVAQNGRKAKPLTTHTHTHTSAAIIYRSGE